jgi:hypothetical protein
MNRPTYDTGFSNAVDDIFGNTSNYFLTLIANSVSPFQLEARLNTEIVGRLQDLQSSLIVMLEDALAEYGEEAVTEMPPEKRMRYYGEKIETALANQCALPAWSPWNAQITDNVRRAGEALTWVSGLFTCVSAFKAAGVTSLKVPLVPLSPAAAMVVFATLTAASAVTASRPELIPLLATKERELAAAWVTQYFKQARDSFDAEVARAEAAMTTYLNNIVQNLI